MQIEPGSQAAVANLMRPCDQSVLPIVSSVLYFDYLCYFTLPHIIIQDL